MSLWKKLAAAASGLAADAHLTREGSIGDLLRTVGQRYVFGRHNNDGIPEQQVAFTVGVIALGAKMAKADGVVTRDEVLAFKEVFKVPDDEMENVSRIYDLAKQDIVGYEIYAKQLASLLKDNHKLLGDVLEGLFHIAVADGVFHPDEEQFLIEVARRFGFTDVEFNYIKARHVGLAEDNPYDVLGISPEISNDALKIHYRKLIADNHPDRMIARGVPPEFVSMATKKVAAINAAYEALTKERHA
jgi:DnaJ like chaperone protein